MRVTVNQRTLFSHFFSATMTKAVRFNETVLVSRLPTQEFMDAHKARAALKSNRPVPFSDEIWDGSIQNFRDVELTPAEFAALKDADSKPLTMNKFARMVTALVLGGDTTKIDMVGSAVKRVNNDEYEDPVAASRHASVQTKAVPIGYDENGEIIWEELTMEELQKRRGSLRRFQPSAPPVDDTTPQPRDGASSASQPAPPPSNSHSDDDKFIEEEKSSFSVASNKLSSEKIDNSLELKRKLTYNQHNPYYSGENTLNFHCGEFRIEFVRNEPLQVGGEMRSRAQNIDSDDDEEAMLFAAPTQRTTLVKKLLRAVFSSKT